MEAVFFYGVRKMKNECLKGSTWLGNDSLLEGSLVGVFASERGASHLEFERCRWAVGMGVHHRGIVGTFKSGVEKVILKNVLEYGGHAVWILDRKLPAGFNGVLCRAFREGRLLVISCFWIPKGIYGTGSFCAQMVQHLAERLVLWAPSSKGFLPQVMSRARLNGKEVMCR